MILPATTSASASMARLPPASESRPASSSVAAAQSATGLYFHPWALFGDASGTRPIQCCVCIRWPIFFTD